MYFEIKRIITYLKTRIHQDLPWDEKIEIIRMLVRRITVDSSTDNDSSKTSETGELFVLCLDDFQNSYYQSGF